MAHPPHDNCPGIPSLERILHFNRQRLMKVAPTLYESIKEIRDMDVKDALEYFMLELFGYKLLCLKLIETVDGADTIEELLEKSMNELEEQKQ